MELTIIVVTLLVLLQMGLMFATVFFTLKALQLINAGKLTAAGGATVAVLWVLTALSIGVFG